MPLTQEHCREHMTGCDAGAPASCVQPRGRHTQGRPGSWCYAAWSLPAFALPGAQALAQTIGIDTPINPDPALHSSPGVLLALVLLLSTMIVALAVCARRYRTSLVRQLDVATLRRRLVRLASDSTVLQHNPDNQLDTTIGDVLQRVEQWLGMVEGFVVVNPGNGTPQTWPHRLALRQQLINELAQQVPTASLQDAHDLILIDQWQGARLLAHGQDVTIESGQWLCIRVRQGRSIHAMLCLHAAAIRGNTRSQVIRAQQLLNLTDFVDLIPLTTQHRDPALTHDASSAAGNVPDPLQQLERLKSIGRMTRGISHDLNNILGVISMNAEAALPGQTHNAPLALRLGEIQDATRRARDLVGAIVDYGRPGSSALQPLDLTALLVGTTPLLRALTPPRISLDIRHPRTPVMVNGNPVQLQQILLNLISNAVEATSGRGRILLEVSAAMDAQGQCPCALLTISDEGTGISPTVLPRIFDQHFTTRPDGNGVGLATVKHLVHMHGGTLEVASQVGRGTRFSIQLPVPTQHPPPAAADQVHRVLLAISPDPVALGQLEEWLAMQGHEPVGCDPDVAMQWSGHERVDAAVILIEAPVRPVHAEAVTRVIRHLQLTAPQLPLILTGGGTAQIDLESCVTSVIKADLGAVNDILRTLPGPDLR